MQPSLRPLFAHSRQPFGPRARPGRDSAAASLPALPSSTEKFGQSVFSSSWQNGAAVVSLLGVFEISTRKCEMCRSFAPPRSHTPAVYEVVPRDVKFRNTPGTAGAPGAARSSAAPPAAGAQWPAVERSCGRGSGTATGGRWRTARSVRVADRVWIRKGGGRTTSKGVLGIANGGHRPKTRVSAWLTLVSNSVENNGDDG